MSSSGPRGPETRRVGLPRLSVRLFSQAEPGWRGRRPTALTPRRQETRGRRCHPARSLSSCEGDGNAAGRERVGSTGQPRPAPRASPLHVCALGTPARSSRRAARLGPPLPPDARCRRGRCRARTSHAFCLKAGDDLGSWSPKAASLLGRCRGGDGVSRGRRRGPRPPLPCSRPPWAPSRVSQRRRRDRRGRRLAVSRALAGRPGKRSAAPDSSDGRHGDGPARASAVRLLGGLVTSESGISLTSPEPRGRQESRSPGPRPVPLPPGSGDLAAERGVTRRPR